MKITKERLTRIIKEEISNVLETSEAQDHQHLLSDPDVGGRRGLKLLIQLKKLTPGEVDSPDKLDDFLSVARRGRHGQELEDLLYDIYSSTHLSIEDIVDYWSSI